MSETEDFIHSSLAGKGWYGDFTLHMLANSGNNRVYRLEAPEGTFLVKHYFQHPDDPRDRFAAERAFYSYLWNAGVRKTPEPFHWLLKERMAVFEFLRGDKPIAATHGMVDQALDFFGELNGKRLSEDAANLPSASEACFSLSEHVDCVERRVARLSGIASETEIDRKAAEFVTRAMLPKWNDVKDHVMRGKSGVEPGTVLSADARCISPSDFGFHNSIQSDGGRLRFFDFEYAGWDDPAKTVCDFFCQPAVPVDHSFFEESLDGFTRMFPQPGLNIRAKLLLPLYQIKWCCIMLNEFLPTSAARRSFALGEANQEGRKAGQLARAEKLCAAISTH